MVKLFIRRFNGVSVCPHQCSHTPRLRNLGRFISHRACLLRVYLPYQEFKRYAPCYDNPDWLIRLLRIWRRRDCVRYRRLHIRILSKPACNFSARYFA